MKHRFHLWLILSLSFFASACDRSRVAGSKARPDAADYYAMAKLSKIVIPVVNFQDTPIEDAVDFLRMCSFQMEGGPPEQRGVSWIIKSQRNDAADNCAGDPVDPDEAPKINYSAKDVGLLTAIEEVARQAHLDVYLTNVGIVICHPGESPLPVGKGPGEEKVWKTIHKELPPKDAKQKGKAIPSDRGKPGAYICPQVGLPNSLAISSINGTPAISFSNLAAAAVIFGVVWPYNDPSFSKST